MCHLFLSISENKTKSKTEELKNIIEKFLYKGTILYKFYDGYGFAWKTHISSTKWDIYKLDKPYFYDIKSRHIIVHIINNEVIIGHVRNDEPRKTRTVASARMDDTHPFYYKNNIFEHNGFIRNFNKHRAFLQSCILPKFSCLIRGQTDTEVLFYLLLTFLETSENEKIAIQNMFGLLRRNGITGLFNMIYGTNNSIVVVRYSLNEGNPLPLYIDATPSFCYVFDSAKFRFFYVFDSEKFRNILITSIKITENQKMIKKYKILVFSALRAA